MRRPQLPAEVAAEARQICCPSSRFCAAIEASLYDPSKKFNPEYSLNKLCCQTEEVYFVNLLCYLSIPKELIKLIPTNNKNGYDRFQWEPKGIIVSWWLVILVCEIIKFINIIFLILKEVYCLFHWCVSIIKENSEHTFTLASSSPFVCLLYCINCFYFDQGLAWLTTVVKPRSRSVLVCFVMCTYLIYRLKKTQPPDLNLVHAHIIACTCQSIA